MFVAEMSFEYLPGKVVSSNAKGDRQRQHQGAKKYRKGGDYRFLGQSNLFQSHGDRQNPNHEANGSAPQSRRPITGIYRGEQSSPRKEVCGQPSDEKNQNGNKDFGVLAANFLSRAA